MLILKLAVDVTSASESLSQEVLEHVNSEEARSVLKQPIKMGSVFVRTPTCFLFLYPQKGKRDVDRQDVRCVLEMTVFYEQCSDTLTHPAWLAACAVAGISYLYNFRN